MKTPRSFSDPEPAYVYELDEPIDFDDRWHQLSSIRVDLCPEDQAKVRTPEDRERVISELCGGWSIEGDWYYCPTVGGEYTRSMVSFNPRSGKTHLIARQPVPGAGKLVAMASPEQIHKVMLLQELENRLRPSD